MIWSGIQRVGRKGSEGPREEQRRKPCSLLQKACGHQGQGSSLSPPLNRPVLSLDLLGLCFFIHKGEVGLEDLGALLSCGALSTRFRPLNSTTRPFSWRELFLQRERGG